MHTNLSAKFRTALVVLLDRYFSLCFCLCSPTGVRCITYPSFNHSSADVGRLSIVYCCQTVLVEQSNSNAFKEW